MGDPDARLTALLERGYGTRVAAVCPIVEYDGGGGVYRVDRRDGPPWVLRRFPRDRPLDRVLGDAAILAHLERHGVPAERLVPPPDGTGATEVDGHGVLVTQFVVGTRPDGGLVTLRRLGDALGRLHALPAVPAGDPWLGRRAGSLPAEDLCYGRAHLDRIAGRVPPADLAAYEALRAALHATDDGDALPFSLTHSDCHLGNFVLAPDGRPVLIDWVGAGQGPRVAALGLLLYSCAVAAPGDAAGGLEPARMRVAVEAVVDAYCRHHALTPTELEYLPDAVRFRPAVVAARELAASIDRGQPPDGSGWWARYAEAEAVAAYARASMERHLEGSTHRE